MRILVLCSDTGVRIGDGKGASLHLRAISHAFAALGHRVEVVGIAPSNPDDARGWTMPVHLVPHPGRSQGPERERRKLAATNAVGRLSHDVAARLRPELIYERLSLFGTAGADLAAATGARHVLEVNALLTAEESAWRGLHLVSLAQEIEQRVIGSADLRVSVSDEVRQAITPAAAGRTSITIPNGVDTEVFAARHDRTRSRAAFGLPRDGVLLGFTGSLRPWHGLDVAVAALAELPERIGLVVAGDGPVRAQLEAQAIELGVEARIHWLGALPHSRVPEMLAACDLALAPYPQLPNFGFSPLKLYEYLAAGTPVVASDIGQIRGALDDGRSGRLVAPGNPAALAAAITAEVAALPAARRRAERAREYALTRHGWADRAARILAAVADVAGQQRTEHRHVTDDVRPGPINGTSQWTAPVGSVRNSPEWPADHPLLTDTALSPFQPAAAELAAGFRVSTVLRHLPGRRVTTLLERETDGHRTVLKVFASPRARGNDRRLRILAASSAAPIVPSSLGTDAQGHVQLVSYHPGVELPQLPDGDFIAGCHRVGIALRRLHDCGAQLDRSWGWSQEIGQLRRHALRSTRTAVDELASVSAAEDPDWVCAHRDCHPGQVVVESTGAVRWIDLDDCTMAPRSLDVGNMVAHLRRENLRGARDLAISDAAELEFLAGYQLASGVQLADLDRWTDVATVRLAALAATRHADRSLHDRMLLGRRPASAATADRLVLR